MFDGILSSVLYCIGYPILLMALMYFSAWGIFVVIDIVQNKFDKRKRERYLKKHSR